MTSAQVAAKSPRSPLSAMRRGLSCACPACGAAPLYGSYLKVRDACPGCGQELHHHRADDAPPYFTVLLVGHFVLAGVLMMEQALAPAAWVQLLLWIPLTVGLALTLLPRIKGALIGLQWANRMHGFGGPGEDGIGPDPLARWH
jgi:uncharacterized protein (DUF983 family)